MIAIGKHQVDVEANLSNKEVHVIHIALRSLMGNIREGREPGDYIDAAEDIDDIKQTIANLLNGFGYLLGK